MTMTDATPSVREIFYNTFGDSQNFMTPEVVSYQVAGPYAVELSRGTGIWNESIYGVTVLELDGTRTTLGGCFDKPEDALEYMAQLAS